MKYLLFHVFYVLAHHSYASEAAKILAICLVEAQSHFSFNNAVLKSLIEVGHEVTTITPFPEQAAAENYTSIIDFSKKDRIFVGQATPDQYKSGSILSVMDEFIGRDQKICSRFINLPEIQKILNSDEKLYDVVIFQIGILYNCLLHVAEKMKIPVIGTLPVRTWSYSDYVIHNPNHPAYIPNEVVAQKWNLDHIFGRMINLWNHIAVAWYKNYVIPPVIEEFHREHVSQLNSLGKYKTIQPDLIFCNNYPSILPKPNNPNVIEIAGVHVKSPKSLPKHIQNFIDEANQGVILFTFGSVVRAATLDHEKKKALRDAFAEIPQRVIWKFEEKLENLPGNVMLLDWLPQRDILEHKNVIAFISHCGSGATHEAVYTATPVVACPLFRDQPNNAKLLERLEVAVHLEYESITKETVLKALNSIINDTKYYNNMQKVSKTFKDRPMTPQQTVVYWTEYVIRNNGAAHLKNPASQLYLFQYLLLDVAFVAILILVIVLYLVNRIFKILFACLTCHKNAKKSCKTNNKKLQ